MKNYFNFILLLIVLLYASVYLSTLNVLKHSTNDLRDKIIDETKLFKSIINKLSKIDDTLNSKILRSIRPAKSKEVDQLQTNLLCIILTSKKSIFQRGPAVWDTWSQKCNKTMFSLNSNDLTLNITETNLKFLNKINILNLPLNESYDKMAEKVILTLKLMYELNDNTTKFNWYLLVDDDTFIYIDNLYKFLKSTDSKLPYTYGYNFKQVVPTGYHSGGGGVVLPIESLERLYESIITDKCPLKNGYSDVALGQCSHISNVKLGNSTDSLERERFHPLDVKDHYGGNYPDWMYSYAKNKVKSGIECCSLESISFHYVKQQDMYKMAKSQNYLDFINGKF
jgi:glycoprotein-N-acetylgalactosamine 3-beta-galactosyltransferase